MSDIIENLTSQMQETLEKGVSLAIFSKNPQVVPLHIFWALLADSNSILNQVFNKMNISKDAVELEIKKQNFHRLQVVQTSQRERQNFKRAYKFT